MFAQEEHCWMPVIKRQRITAGGQLEGVHHIHKGFSWRYGENALPSCKAFFLILPELTVRCMQIFLDHFAAIYANDFGSAEIA